MKNLKKQTQENPKKSIATVITAIIGVATIFINQSKILGIDAEIVKWTSFGIAVLTFALSMFHSNKKKKR